MKLIGQSFVDSDYVSSEKLREIVEAVIKKSKEENNGLNVRPFVHQVICKEDLTKKFVIVLNVYIEE